MMPPLITLTALLPAAAFCCAALPPQDEACRDLLYLNEELSLSTAFITRAAAPADADDVLQWGGTLDMAAPDADTPPEGVSTENLFSAPQAYDFDSVYELVPEVDAPIYTLIGVTAALARRRRA